MFSYAFKDYLSKNSSTKDIDAFFQKIYTSDDAFINQERDKIKNIIPAFPKFEPKSHICYKEVRYHYILQNLLKKDSDIKIIGLIRNPFSVINSWLRAPKEFKVELGWKIEDEWRYAPSKNENKPEEFNGYEKWKEVTFLFLELQRDFPKRFYLLKYENLLESTFKEVKQLFSFCELSFDKQTQLFLETSTQTNNSDPYSVYRIKKDDSSWQEELPAFIIQEIKNDPKFWQLNEVFNWI